jgi:hypothetical protein
MGSTFFRFFIAYLLRYSLRDSQSLTDDVHVYFRCGNAAFALLLENVQHENRFAELDRIDGPVRAAFIVLDDLQDAGAAETLEHLGRTVLFAVLREVQCVAEELANFDGQRQQVPFAAPYPGERFFLYLNRYSWQVDASVPPEQPAA